MLIISDTVEFSGAEEAIVNLAKLLWHQKNVELRFCSSRFSDSEAPRLPFESSLSINRPKPRSIEELYGVLTRPTTLAKTILHCRAIAESFQPDLVHSGILLSILPSIMVAQAMRIPVLGHVHDYRLLSLTDLPFIRGFVDAPTYAQELNYYLRMVDAPKAILGLGLRRSLLSLHNRCNVLIAVSNFVKNSLSRFLRPSMEVLYNVRYNFAQNELNKKKPDRATITYSGRLSAAKGFRVFLDAANLVLKKMDAEIHITGSGDLAPIARGFVSDHRESACFHGYMQTSELHDLVARSHMTMHPSLWPEPCPLSVIKSVCLGTTAFGSRRGGLSELLPPKYLFEPDPSDICHQVVKFFDNPKDYPPALAVDLDERTVARRIISIYDHLIRHSSQGTPRFGGLDASQ